MTAGIYAIVNAVVNAVTGEEYIGKSYDIEHRFGQHKTALRGGCHNKAFQAAWDTYGATAFTLVIIEGSPVYRPGSDMWNRMDALERQYIAERKPAYNWMCHRWTH